MVEPLISATNVTRTFGEFTAVHDVSLSVGSGEILGLLGANGAGKTTLIRMILGVLGVSAGEITLFGEPPSRATRARLGYVPQGLGLWDDLTVQENLDFIAGTYGKDAPELPAALGAIRTSLVGGIGLGHQRQVAFAAALGHTPELLVLDEPTSGVDPLSRARLWDLIHDAADRGVGVLVTTHYMQEAQQCDRLVLMSQGAAVAAGTEADIVKGTSVVAVQTARWHDAFTALAAADMVVMLAGTGVRVVGVQPDAVETALTAAGISGTVAAARPTLEETMAARERAS